MSKPIASFDEQAVKDELCELVGKTIEETISAMLDEEADQLVGAGPYERTDERGFTTTSGQVTLKMPKLKGMRFATAVIERYKRREASVEETIVEMYLAGVSTRRIEDVSEILWGAGVFAGTVSNLNEKVFKAIDEWRCRPLTRAYPYVYIDGIYLKRSWGAPTRTSPPWSPSARSRTAIARRSDAPRASPSRPSAGAISRRG